MFANCVVFVWTTFLSVVCHDDALLRRLDWANPFLTADEKAGLVGIGLPVQIAQCEELEVKVPRVESGY